MVTCDAGTQYSSDDIFVDIQLEPPCLISAPKKTPGDDVPLAEPPLPSPSILLSPLKPSIDYKPSDLSILDAAEEANDEESSVVRVSIIVYILWLSIPLRFSIHHNALITVLIMLIFSKQFMSCVTSNFLFKNNAMEFVHFQL